MRLLQEISRPKTDNEQEQDLSSDFNEYSREIQWNSKRSSSKEPIESQGTKPRYFCLSDVLILQPQML